ncbi:hypothetical protein VNO78_10715 [Psophocarpus tetragonolobus]|uniref:Uncharacterized protein n=1 Tax=Psophocarpus tetragonolobus TaxID=3891 RepID=A0AAN9SK66_PSOTE
MSKGKEWREVRREKTQEGNPNGIKASRIGFSKECLAKVPKASYENVVKFPKDVYLSKMETDGRITKVSTYNFSFKLEAKNGYYESKQLLWGINMGLLETNDAKDIKEYIDATKRKEMLDVSRFAPITRYEEEGVPKEICLNGELEEAQTSKDSSLRGCHHSTYPRRQILGSNYISHGAATQGHHVEDLVVLNNVWMIVKELGVVGVNDDALHVAKIAQMKERDRSELVRNRNSQS